MGSTDGGESGDIVTKDLGLTEYLDNNDGITVLDVTTPGIPAYCFVKLGRRSMKPLTAREYLRGYYSVPDPDQIDSLTGMWPVSCEFGSQLRTSIRRREASASV
jgi:hypothetical protein